MATAIWLHIFCRSRKKMCWRWLSRTGNLQFYNQLDSELSYGL